MIKADLTESSLPSESFLERNPDPKTGSVEAPSPKNVKATIEQLEKDKDALFEEDFVTGLIHENASRFLWKNRKIWIQISLEKVVANHSAFVPVRSDRKHDLCTKICRISDRDLIRSVFIVVARLCFYL